MVEFSAVKKIYFYCGLPRSGNTLLSCILNQNPEISATAHSILPDLMFYIEKVKHHSTIYNNFPDSKSIDNISKNLFNSYYKDWKSNIIIERGEWVTPCNFSLLERHFQSEIKIIVLVRDVLDILKSYINLCNKDKKFHINQIYNGLDKTTLYKSEVEEKCDIVMQKNSFVDTMLYSIKWLLENNKQDHLHFVNYNDLVDNTEYTISGIYEFLNIDYYKHRFTNLEQLNINDVTYNDDIPGIGGNMHTIRSDKIEFIESQVELPEKVVNKYSGLRLWP